MGPEELPRFTFEAIGVVRSPFRSKSSAPRQPSEASEVAGTLELRADLLDAVSDLAGWDHLWVVFVFDRSEGYRPKVLPPRSDVRRGVLATRSPHRPNPIGLSVVRLERVEGTVLHVRGLDMLDGTPVLDVKPYVAYVDAIPDASAGWLVEDPGPRFEVRFAERARDACAWLEARGEADLATRVTTLLATGPRPHAYRRIRALEGGRHVLSVGALRFHFAIDGRVVTVLEVRSGHRPKDLAVGRGPELDLHRALTERFGGGA